MSELDALLRERLVVLKWLAIPDICLQVKIFHEDECVTRMEP